MSRNSRELRELEQAILNHDSGTDLSSDAGIHRDLPTRKPVTVAAEPANPGRLSVAEQPPTEGLQWIEHDFLSGECNTSVRWWCTCVPVVPMSRISTTPGWAIDTVQGVVERFVHDRGHDRTCHDGLVRCAPQP